MKHQKLLALAYEAFMRGDYDISMSLYGEVLASFPRLIEAKVGAMLSDFAGRHKEEANVLFDFFFLMKADFEEAAAAKAIEEAMQEVSEARSSMSLLDERSMYGEGIGYSDFLALADGRESFKRALEDILFSTKVIITSKEEFVDFVHRLVDAGMKETALRYLDASGAVFGNDQDVLALYGMLEGA